MKYIFIFFTTILFSQSRIEQFLNPSDTLNSNRLKKLVIAESLISSSALIGLSATWYKDYPQSKFHFINDNNEWLQMDKVGHIYSSYHLGRLGAETLAWSGVYKKNQLIYGATLGFAFLSVVEVFDGYSAQWGASMGDVIANGTGTALYISQELLWKEQRIVPKFSFHTTQYSQYRPNTLGKSLSEEILKDYNGQTYWLSANLYSFTKNSKIPKWLNLAVGYGADGMIYGNSNETDTTLNIPNFERKRQFYLSFDIDLTKIKTKSHTLKTLLSVFNTIKIPAPTVEFTGSDAKFYVLYF